MLRQDHNRVRCFRGWQQETFCVWTVLHPDSPTLTGFLLCSQNPPCWRSWTSCTCLGTLVTSDPRHHPHNVLLDASLGPSFSSSPPKANTKKKEEKKSPRTEIHAGAHPRAEKLLVCTTRWHTEGLVCFGGVFMTLSLYFYIQLMSPSRQYFTASRHNETHTQRGPIENGSNNNNSSSSRCPSDLFCGAQRRH